MRYTYYLCDVFTRVRFGGNQLAVLPHAEGLNDEQMLKIAREFNLTQTTFVFPPQGSATRKVRIFTPTTEVPFAGHPNIGTAFVLAMVGEFGILESTSTIFFEEKAGLVPISILRQGSKPLVCLLAAPEPLSLGKTTTPEVVARAVSLEPEDIVCSVHPPQEASVGLPFLIAELRDRDALERADVDRRGINALADLGLPTDVHVYLRSNDEYDFRVRVFAPRRGVPEDPASGSANCAMVGLLAHLEEAPTGRYHWHVAQGMEMGRPSMMDAEADKKEGLVFTTRVGGACVMVGEGYIEV